MKQFDKRVDAYIAKSEDFAKPILLHLRALVHEACPDAEEILKWNFPHFDYKGMMCSMAAFKKHCAFGFWKASLMKDARKFAKAGTTAMGHLGRITSLDDLPPDRTLLSHIKEAARLNNESITVRRKPKATRIQPLRIPPDLRQALSRSPKAQEIFNGFATSKKKDYVEWVTEVKTSETRARRLATAIDWIAQGKERHWKYRRRIS